MSLTSLIIQLLLLALFLSINNFAVSIGIGFSHIWKKIRWKIAIVFGLFDFLAPLIGIYIGGQLASNLGQVIGYLGVSIIFTLGLFLIHDGWRKHKQPGEHSARFSRHFIDKAVASLWAISIIAVGVSFDNLIVGFGLGTLEVPIVTAVIIFGLVTFLMALLGIFIGGKIRARAELRITNLMGRGRIITGIVFIVIALWKYFEIL